MWQVRTHSTCINLRAAASNVPMSRDRSGVRLHKSRRVKGTRRCSECVCFDLPGCAPRGSNRTRIALCCPFTPHFLPTTTVCRTRAALWTVTEPFQGSGAICSRRVGPPPLQTQISPRSLLILPSVFVLVSEGNGRAHARTRKVPVPGVRGEIHDTLTPPTPGAVSRGLRLRAPYARLRLCGEGGGCFWAADGPHLRCVRRLSVEV